MAADDIIGHYAFFEEKFVPLTRKGPDLLHPVSLDRWKEQAKARGLDVIIVSACKGGISFRNTGAKWRFHEVEALARKYTLVFICPASLGRIPRTESTYEIEPGHDGDDVLDGKARVFSSVGEDMTDAFILGARRALAIVRNVGASIVLFMDRCTACGVHAIYDASSPGHRRPGRGVTAALLARQGIKVMSYRRDRMANLDPPWVRRSGFRAINPT